MLEVGDYYQITEGMDFVGKNEIVLIDNLHNLYEKINGKLSLIGTNATIYDKNLKVKDIVFD
jgi:hypothetical protein